MWHKSNLIPFIFPFIPIKSGEIQKKYTFLMFILGFDMVAVLILVSHNGNIAFVMTKTMFLETSPRSNSPFWFNVFKNKRQQFKNSYCDVQAPRRDTARK